MTSRIKLTVGDKTFIATLEDSPTTSRLRDRLPLTLAMSELNGNEKYYKLDAPLPTNASKPGTIRAGDLMLYGDDTLVLFYETFRSTYSYTRLGTLDDSIGLVEALGEGKVSIRFEAE